MKTIHISMANKAEANDKTIDVYTWEELYDLFDEVASVQDMINLIEQKKGVTINWHWDGEE